MNYDVTINRNIRTFVVEPFGIKWQSGGGGGGGVSLGETSTTAYRGDRGKLAYDHSISAHAPSDAEKNVNSDWNSTSGDSQILNKPNLGLYQTRVDSGLNTSEQIIVDAINEVNSLAKGSQRAIAYGDYRDMIDDILLWGVADVNGNIGQSILIGTLDVPDLWIISQHGTFVNYIYTTDQDFVNDLNADGIIRIGYYSLSKLETAKVDLSNYYTKSQVDSAMNTKVTGSGSINRIPFFSTSSTVITDADLVYVPESNHLKIGISTDSSPAALTIGGQVSGDSFIYGGGGSLQIEAGTLAINTTGQFGRVSITTGGVERFGIEFDGVISIPVPVDINGATYGDSITFGGTINSNADLSINGQLGSIISTDDTNGIININADVNYGDLYIYGSTNIDNLFVNGNPQSGTNTGDQDLSNYATTDSIQDKRDRSEVGDLHGFVNPPNSSNFTLSNSGSSVTITLLQNAGDCMVNGTLFYSSSLPITKVFTASIGQNFVYLFNDANAPGLGVSSSQWDIMDLTKIPVCTINYDGTNVRLGDELHSSKRNLIEHKKQHDTDGARYVSGFLTSFGSGAANTFSSASGVIRDEDRYHSIDAKTNGMIAYRNSTSTAMIFNSASTQYAKMNSSVPRYDNAGTLTDIASGSYGISWMYATNAKLPTNSEIVFVIGQGTYTSLSAAQSAAQPTLSGMSVAEWKLLYRVIYRNVGGALSFSQADDMRLLASGPATLGSSGQSFVSQYLQTDSSATSGTITMETNQVLVLTTTLTNSHTMTITQGSPIASYANEWVLMFDTGATVPSITFTPPSGVTYRYMGGVLPTLSANKAYVFSFLRKSDTLYNVNYTSN